MSGARVLHYEIVRPLGRGGMGEVVEALDTRLGRPVALKFVAAELAADAVHLKRFEREARAAGGLTHPNIAVVHAFEIDQGRPFLVMELLPGPTLRSLLGAGPLSLPQALRIARETASALAFAHGRPEPIAHRDVKPENLMFDGHGAIKLMDFGLAHAASAVRLTRTDTTLGTPAYMAPEAFAGRSAAASDLFALGAILHEMLAGELPFSGENLLALMYAISNLPPRPLLEARPEAGEGVATLVAGLLDKSPEARPTAEQVVRAFDEMAGSPPRTTPPPDARTEPLQRSGVQITMPRTEDLPAVRAGSRLPAVLRTGTAHPRRALALTLTLLALLAGGFFTWRLTQERAAARHAAALATSDQGTQALIAHDLVTAETRFRSALRLDSRLHPAAIGMAAIAAAHGDRSGAAAQLRRILSELPRGEHALRATAMSQLSEIAIADGNWPDATVQLRRAFAEDSSDAAAYNQLGYALMRIGAADSARVLLERGIQRFPAVAPLQKNVGLAALALDDVDFAGVAAAAALAVDPAYVPAMALQARVLARRGDKAGAASAWQRYLASGGVDSVERAETTRDLAAHGVSAPHANSE